MGTGFKDHFSGVADAYAAARPEYPDALFDAIAAHVAASGQVWEPGCGSGQATRGLAARFAHVHATDASAQQIARHWAAPHDPGIPEEVGPGVELSSSSVPRGQGGAFFHGDPLHTLPVATREPDAGPCARVTVAVEPAEHTSLADGSVKLVAVAQALHWFDRAAFFAECARVLAPSGVLAAWGYGDFLTPDGMDEAIGDFRARIHPHWPAERALVDRAYADFQWPFPALEAPALCLEAQWTFAHFLRYLASMSAVARYGETTGQDLLATHAPALALEWGAPERVRTIRWPLFLHLRRKPDRAGPPEPG
ncbi:class I SAM-dependent methyltransferase [Agrilutibacter solisilvae]|uniref:Class I SAM-dependent methyltransferase n=1 Tax=Agrilutibacter solisilvae TaxID=2763317 RepID=A0A974XZE6_9GAMM|nr:class I SAM-dependent methyltransferase [Lysobacter solisilvae]QSX78582.1 class I SAM-dependent methyltransferase [Lysobacter solisilvae]